MRDIRKDLEERLAAIDDEKLMAQARLVELSRVEENLRAVLSEERARYRQEQKELFDTDSGEEESPYAQFVLSALADGKVWTGADLKRLGIFKEQFAGQPALGRLLHVAAIDLKRRGLVRSLGFGKWQLVAEEAKGEEPEDGELDGASNGELDAPFESAAAE
jgi:hypothetical protein